MILLKKPQELLFLWLIIMSPTVHAQHGGHVCYINGQQETQNANNNTVSYDINDIATLDLRDIKGLYETSTPNYSIRNTTLKSAWSYLNEDGNNLIYTIVVNRSYYENLFIEDDKKKAILIYIIAHEYAHCRMADAMYSPDQSMYTNYSRELAADEQAGYAVAQLTKVDISFLDELNKLFNLRIFSTTHPAPEYRILQAKYGWIKGKMNGIQFGDTLNMVACRLLKTNDGRGNQNYECLKSANRLSDISVSLNSTDGTCDISLNIYSDQGNRLSAKVYVSRYLMISSSWGKSDADDNYIQLVESNSLNMSDYMGLMPSANGSWYQGTWKNESMSKGIMNYKNNEVYNGLFSLDSRFGWGRMDYADGSTYIGEWWEDERQGKGVLYKGKMVISQGIWKDDKLCPDCKE